MQKNLVDYLHEIDVSINDIKDKYRNFYDKNILIAFRGESKNYGVTSLMPSIFRDSSHIAKERQLFELSEDYGLVNKSDSNIERIIEIQHYVAISRMVDISFNSLVAIYFACESHNSEKEDFEDGYVYVFGFPEYYSPHSKYIEDFYKSVLNNKHDLTYYKNFRVFSHCFLNERVRAQFGGFIFFPGQEFSRINNAYYNKVRIAKEDKNKILKELNIMFGINESSLFPDKPIISNEIKRKFKEISINSKEFSIDEQINSCFERINIELKMNMSLDKKQCLRWLRKEKNDLLIYLKMHKDKVNDEKIENINNFFRVAEIVAKGVK